jgi:hypothetical protein
MAVCPLPSRADPPPKIPAYIYPPIVQSSVKAPAYSITFIWNAQSEESRRLFRQYVGPIVEAQRTDVSLRMVQIIAPDARDVNGPGALLLCAPDAKTYSSNVFAYLGLETPLTPYTVFVKDAKFPYYTNPTLKLMQEKGLFDFQKCPLDPKFLERTYFAMGVSGPVGKSFRNAVAGVISLNGKVLGHDDKSLQPLKQLAVKK